MYRDGAGMSETEGKENFFILLLKEPTFVLGEKNERKFSATRSQFNTRLTLFEAHGGCF
jgi:hypothetical protein